MLYVASIVIGRREKQVNKAEVVPRAQRAGSEAGASDPQEHGRSQGPATLGDWPGSPACQPVPQICEGASKRMTVAFDLLQVVHGCPASLSHLLQQQAGEQHVAGRRSNIDHGAKNTSLI